MDKVPSSTPPESAWLGSLISYLLLAGLVIGHGWMTVALFGPDSWQRLTDDQPIVSGEHPQHLYLGFLGAQGLWHNGRSCVFDPAFQAGFPKTPVFNGSRLAELCLTACGGRYCPAAYKIGVALLWFSAPLFLVLACAGTGIGGSGTLLATTSGLLIWWGPWARGMLNAGDVDLLLAGLAVLAHTGLLVRFHRSPTVCAWTGLVLSALVAWFAQPLLLPLLLPTLLVYYFCYGPRHAALTWHLALWGGELAAVGLNAFWLVDWISYWWLRSPLPHYNSGSLLQNWETFWQAPLWGCPADRGFVMGILGSGLVGLVWMNQRPTRPAARLFGLGSFGFLALAILGVTWEPLGEIGSAGWLFLALCFAAVPAGFFAGRVIGLVIAPCNGWARAAIGALGLVGIGAMCAQPWFASWWQERVRLEPLQLGLDIERAEVVEKLRVYTTTDGRILWEDQPASNADSRWPALLPLLTGRAFIGGLDPDGAIEHSQVGFLNHALAGRPMSAWSDVSLDEYCRRYNVGWIVCRSSSSVERFKNWPGCELAGQFGKGSAWHLFALKNPAKSYALKGHARIVEASAQRITLADVVPEGGVVVLSMHYQSGLRAAPARVEVEREPDASDPIGFIRLRLSSPAARVTLTWDGH